MRRRQGKQERWGEEGRKGKMMREKDGAVQEGDKNGGEGEEEGREE